MEVELAHSMTSFSCEPNVLFRNMWCFSGCCRQCCHDIFSLAVIMCIHISSGAAKEEEDGSLGPNRRWSRSPRSPTQDDRKARRAERRARRHNPTEGTSPREPTSTRHQVRYSPYGARSYYDQIYQGRVAPQYDHHFYQQQGSAVGPYRALPRYHRQQQEHQQVPTNAPRQYRGPRPYRSPAAADTTTPARQEEAPESFKTPDAARTPRLRSHGPIRTPLTPGFRDGVVSPNTPRRSARMTPY
ncbi:hypothetical protein GWK47_033133 [Chionoecetes opilio]|uniref:Uncharacterized protein n=1 Tax=Chionoecetes opilio TaxID=41210 RepID=A0A8J5D0F6_CHIOP|nr:hypothetical protein GWK47_033133 [Chionoecetes opilio]